MSLDPHRGQTVGQVEAEHEGSVVYYGIVPQALRLLESKVPMCIFKDGGRAICLASIDGSSFKKEQRSCINQSCFGAGRN